MKPEGSPYRKAAMAAPLQLRSVPRISRVLMFAFVCIGFIFFLSRLDSGLSGRLPFSGGRGGPKYDVLEYIDPLIGTTNGGESLSIAMIRRRRQLTDHRTGHVFPGATLPYGKLLSYAMTPFFLLTGHRNGQGRCRHQQPC